MKLTIDLSHMPIVVAVEIIGRLGGDATNLHTDKRQMPDGSWVISAYARNHSMTREQIIDVRPLYLLRYQVSIDADGIVAYQYTKGKNSKTDCKRISIDPIWRYLWLCKVIAEAPPTYYSAHGELCFQDESGRQVFASVRIDKATLDPETGDFTIVQGSFHVDPASIATLSIDQSPAQ